ncbi:MAG: hypothetical protein FWG43_05285, partial [Clostridiales bacterium]|nr:hypothetical protein [Clostridiales bacterium]
RILGRLLLNIHGQMEHMLLLEEEQQLRLLDSFGGAELLQIKEQVGGLFTQLREKQRLYNDYLQHKTERRERMVLLAEQIEELEQAALKPNEEDYLRQESQRLSHGEKLLSLSAAAQQELSGAQGALESFSAVATALRQIARLDEQMNALAQRVESLYFEAEDIDLELTQYAAAIATDAYRLDELESRLALLGRLKKKYQGHTEQLLDYLQQARLEHAALDELDFSGTKINQQLQEAQSAYDKAADSLYAARMAASASLATAINEELQLLCMNQATFHIDLTPDKPSALGREKAVFMIQSNVGEEFRPVARIASGGELSRIVLAMKVILAQLDFVPTLVFDEVDSGLGGRALNAVASRLAYVSQNTQSIVVTHMPVMAAAANSQLHVEKHVAEGRTQIAVALLTGEERVEELSRMIAGENLSETTRNQARELLERNW